METINQREATPLTSAVLALLLVVSYLNFSSSLFAQDTGRTVRHHKVSDGNPVPQQISQAETAIEKKEYATAQALLDQVVTADPNNYQAWFDLGFVYHALGKPQDSIAAYRKSVAAKPDVFESNVNLGMSLAAAHQADAEQYLRAATKLQPTANVQEGKEQAWLSLGHVIGGTNPDGAIEAFRQAATLRPSDVEPYLSAAPLLEMTNHFADAEQDYKQVLALQPNSSDALTGLANLYMRGQKFPEALDVLRKLVAVHPNDAGAHMQLGRMLAAAGQNDEAISELQTAIKLDPTDAGAQRDLGDLYVKAGKNDKAQALYQSLLAANPNNPELRDQLGKALLRQKNYLDAQQQFLLAVKLKPDFGEAYGDLGFAADENKNYELAIRALDERAKFLPEVPVTFFVRASAYDHLRDYKKASENYHRFLEVANGKYPDQEWQATHRLIAIEPKKK
ncbi:MAG: Tetratricopeptide repeat protein [Acidobacteriaceae bacterium]|nr:Tetratricopeptide repeat protein [Acidobacteriaceae bacterium]